MRDPNIGLDRLVDELLEVAKARGPLAASDLNQVRDHLGATAVDQDYFFAIVLGGIETLPSRYVGHARLLLRREDYDESLTERRKIASTKYRASSEGTARVQTERYVLAQVLFNVFQALQGIMHAGQGYEIESARFLYWFEPDNPSELRTDIEFDLLITRDNVRVFTFGSEPDGGDFCGIECLSTDLGHRFLDQVPVRSSAPKAEHYAFFYLGGDTPSGTRTTIALRECWNVAIQGPIREQAVMPLSGGGPLTITLDAPRCVVSHYASFGVPHKRPHRIPPPGDLIERIDDNPVTLLVENPDASNIYGFWYRVILE